MNDDGFDLELENIRNRRLEELTMSETNNDWPSSPVNVSDSEFHSFVKKYPYVIVDCWAPWCNPCRMLGPVIDEMAGDYKGKVVFGKLNTDENQATAMSLEIMSIPTLLFFKNGELVDRTMGAMPRQALEPKVREYL
jgi:thioredoxin 1